jgi:cell division protein FtsZ
MGSASASGENRAKEAIIAALDSPLLDDNKISGAKNVLLLIVSGSNEITIDEIGEINDHIQSEAGHNANIIMGVGEDEKLGESIAVTIIATGFNEEQQNGILSIEAKKIIHSLDGEHKLERDLTQKPVEVFQTKIESPIEFNEEKIIFELIEEEIESTEGEFVQQIANVVSDISENELIAMNQFIRNLDVTFEIVSPINDIDFNVATPEALEMKVVEPIIDENLKQVQVEEEQITFTFDMPAVKLETIETIDESRVVFDLSAETRDIEVNEHVQFVSVTELNEGGIIKYSLEEYMEVENDLLNSKPVAKVVEEPIADELKITMKQMETEKPQSFVSQFEDVSPVEMTIEETLKHRADERRRKLKEFNYKFNNNPSRVDEMEKEPAYKRHGIDLSNNTQTNNASSRMSLGTDSNDDLQIRSNNSFLHDNVD